MIDFIVGFCSGVIIIFVFHMIEIRRTEKKLNNTKQKLSEIINEKDEIRNKLFYFRGKYYNEIQRKLKHKYEKRYKNIYITFENGLLETEIKVKTLKPVYSSYNQYKAIEKRYSILGDWEHIRKKQEKILKDLII